jgi:hypothetical protein
MCCRFRSSATVCFLLLFPVLLWLPSDEAIPVAVRFTEGAIHGFLVLSSADHDDVIASGDLRQVTTGKGILCRPS